MCFIGNIYISMKISIVVQIIHVHKNFQLTGRLTTVLKAIAIRWQKTFKYKMELQSLERNTLQNQNSVPEEFHPLNLK